MTVSSSRQVFGLLLWLGTAALAAGIGGLASIDAAAFYAQLDRPSWSPPGWLFGPVWTALYAMMGVAAWLVWREGGFARSRSVLTLFIIQLAVNALWSWLFFEWRKGLLAFIDTALLWCLIVATILAFRRIKPLAALLLVPYLGWVTFATALTHAIWRANPELLD